MRTVTPYNWTFERRVMRRVKINETTGCWIWLGATMHNGYGQLAVGGTHFAAHRYVYEQLVGPIPEGLDLDHLCRQRPCVNPEHLEPVTRSVNLKRGRLGDNSGNRRKTQCLHGHPFDAANTRITPRGTRSCRACARELGRRRREAARAD